MSDLLCGGLCKEKNLQVKAVRIILPWKGLCQSCFEKYERKEFCAGCLEQGKKRFATVKINGLLLCREHAGAAAIEDGPPQTLELQDVEVRKEKPMGEKPDQATINAIRKDSAAGLNVNEVANKHGIGWATAKKYSAGAAATNGKAPKQAKRSPAARHTGKGYDSVLESLKVKRDAYNRAIEALESVDA